MQLHLLMAPFSGTTTYGECKVMSKSSNCVCVCVCVCVCAVVKRCNGKMPFKLNAFHRNRQGTLQQFHMYKPHPLYHNVITRGLIQSTRIMVFKCHTSPALNLCKCIKPSMNHISLIKLGLDVMHSHTQDTIQPIPGPVSRAEVTRRW